MLHHDIGHCIQFCAITIIAAKFNCSVPGTLITNNSTKAQLVTVTNGKDLATPSLASTMLIIHDQITSVTNLSTVTMPPSTEFIDRLSISGIVLVIVGGITILIATMMVCAMVLFRKFNGRKSSNKAAQQQTEGITVSCMQIANIKNPCQSTY